MNTEKETVNKGDYPVRLDVDYPEKLDRFSTFFRRKGNIRKTSK